ncbi:transposase, partial [bacterium]|nr:transposase [bacterium]
DILLSSFCLMDNHLHLIVLRQSISLYKFMHRLLTKYALYFNKKYKRKGHLFNDRYHSFIILKERYLIIAVIYVNQNPVKAGKIEKSVDYRFSSAKCYYGLEDNPFITKIPNFKGDEGIKNYIANSPEEFVELEIYRDSIGMKGDYIFLNKRKLGRDKEKYIERRDIKGDENINNIIRKLLIEKMQIKEKMLQMIRSKKKRSDIIKLRQKAVLLLYAEGFTLSEIARFMNKSLPTIFNTLKKYGGNKYE